VRMFRGASVMSALPPKADICSALAHVRFGPKADMQFLSLPLSLHHLRNGYYFSPLYNEPKEYFSGPDLCSAI
jgi:hypothetical protein